VRSISLGGRACLRHLEFAVDLVAHRIARPSLLLFVVAADQHHTIGVRCRNAHDGAPDLHNKRYAGIPMRHGILRGMVDKEQHGEQNANYLKKLLHLDAMCAAVNKVS
jgi:hypothetical protein